MSDGKGAFGLPRLLDDIPEKDDFFGAHTGIARTLSDYIGSSDIALSIALEGAWGSGKSTVIKHLDSNSTDNEHIFTFDTWAAQDDPIALSFWENFVAWVSSVEHYENDSDISEALRNTREDLRRRRERIEETDIDERPSFPNQDAIKFGVATILAIPLSFILRAIPNFQLAEFEVPGGVVLAAFAWFVPVWHLSQWHRRWRNDPKRNETPEGKAKNFWTDEVAGSIIRQPVGKRQLIVRRGPVATSGELTASFKTLLAKIFDKFPNDRIVIVFDNIDRLATSNSAGVWSLYYLLTEATRGLESAANRVWYIVPIDPKTVPIPVLSSPPAENARKAPGSDSFSPVRSRYEFLEKTFQITVRVPPPIRHIGQDYFQSQYDRAFHNTRYKDQSYDAYIALRAVAQRDGPITPRRIKRFLNDLSLQLMAREHIDPEKPGDVYLVSFYVALKDQLVDIEGVLSSASESRWSKLLNRPIEDAIGKLAAIHYGVKTSDGLHVLIERAVEDSIDQASYRPISHLVELPGFSKIYSEILHTSSAEWEKNRVEALITSVGFLSKMPEPVRRLVSSNIKSIAGEICRELSFSSLSESDVSEEYIREGIAISIALIMDENPNLGGKAANMVANAAVNLEDESEGESREAGTIASEWINEISHIVDVCEEPAQFRGQIKPNPEVIGASYYEVWKKLCAHKNLSNDLLSPDSDQLEAITNNWLSDVENGEESALDASKIDELLRLDESLVVPDVLAAVVKGLSSRVYSVEQYSKIDAVIRTASGHISDPDGRAHLQEIGEHGLWATAIDVEGFSEPSVFKAALNIWTLTGVGPSKIHDDGARNAVQQVLLKGFSGLASEGERDPFLNELKRKGELERVISWCADSEAWQALNEILDYIAKNSVEDLGSSHAWKNKVMKAWRNIDESVKDAFSEIGMRHYKLHEKALQIGSIGVSDALEIANLIPHKGMKDAFYRKVGQSFSTKSVDWWESHINPTKEAMAKLVRNINMAEKQPWLPSGLDRLILAEIKSLNKDQIAERQGVLQEWIRALPSDGSENIVSTLLSEALASSDMLTRERILALGRIGAELASKIDREVGWVDVCYTASSQEPDQLERHRETLSGIAEAKVFKAKQNRRLSEILKNSAVE